MQDLGTIRDSQTFFWLGFAIISFGCPEFPQQMELKAYESAFPGPLRYFATDGGNWPPSALAFIRQGDADVFLTVGMALRPQPGADGLPDDTNWRRIELGFAFAEPLSDADIRQVASY